jgi:hypothetical protein
VPIDVMSETSWEHARDHAWRYFEIHSGQRMTMFNYFTVFAGLVLAGIGATLQGSPRLSAIGVPLGLLLALLSFVFWKLDQRMSFLVKHSEAAQRLIEEELLPPIARLFQGEAVALAIANTNAASTSKVWTFGRSLRLTFSVMAAVGLTASILSGLRAAGCITLEKQEPPVVGKPTGRGTEKMGAAATTSPPDAPERSSEKGKVVEK